MKIEFKLEDVLDQNVLEETRRQAEEAHLPMEIYLFRHYNELFLGANVNRDIIKAKPHVIREQREPSKPTPFDHLALSTRPHNILVNNFENIEDILVVSYDELLKLKGAGRGSVDLIVNALIAHEHMNSVDDLGVEVEVDEGLSLDDDTGDIDYFDQISNLDMKSTKSVAAAGRIYMAAWEMSKDDAHDAVREIILDIYDKSDEDSYGLSILEIRKNLPMVEYQVEEIFARGEKLGEDSSSTEDRAMACHGKQFSCMTWLDAEDILEELKKDLEETHDVPTLDDDWDM